MKRFAGLLVVLAVMLSSSAFGATQDFGKFTAYIPAGWTAHEQNAGVFIVRDDGAAQFGIMFGKLDKGQTLEQLARAVCASVKGTDFEEDEDGDFDFNYMMGDKEAYGLIIGSIFEEGDEDDFMYWIMSGFDVAEDELDVIRGSIHVKDK